MKKSVYEKGRYTAITSKAVGIASQITSKISIKTPNIYDNKKTINVIALWDTGATGSCISGYYAKQLGLVPTDFQDSYGVGGLCRVPVYDIVVDLNDYVKGINLVVSEAKLNKYDGGPDHSEIGFLIGMDIISQGDFFVGQYKEEDNKNKTMFSFRFPSAQDPTDYLEEIREYNNSKIVEINKTKNQINKRNYKRYVSKISKKHR